VKASAHSRSSSILVGALIGLLLGAAAAVIGDGRSGRLRRS
jgi:gas vesicle protein